MSVIYEFTDLSDAKLTIIAAKYNITQGEALGRLLRLACWIDDDMISPESHVVTNITKTLLRPLRWQDYMRQGKM